jgi:hypothetical protein
MGNFIQDAERHIDEERARWQKVKAQEDAKKEAEKRVKLEKAKQLKEESIRKSWLHIN